MVERLARLQQLPDVELLVLRQHAVGVGGHDLVGGGFAVLLDEFLVVFGLAVDVGHAVLDEAEDTLCGVHLDDEQALKGLDVREG